MLVNIHESCVKNISRKSWFISARPQCFHWKTRKGRISSTTLYQSHWWYLTFCKEGKGNILLSSILPTQNLRSVFVKLHSRVMFHANLINSFLFDCLPNILSIVFINVKPLTQYTKTFLSQYCECNIL